jgi:putative DNA primase/helicase
MADRLTQALPDRAPDRKSFAERVAEKLIAELEKGTAPWQKPWSAGAVDYLPHNPTTGKRYKGVNALMLAAQGRDDTRWMTYKQAQAEGAQVRKGERGTPIQFWQYTDTQERRDADGKPVIDQKTGKPVLDEVRLERPKVFTAVVFNAEQIDGLPPPTPARAVTWNPNEKAEALLAASGADIRHSDQGRAFYRPGTDAIQLPHKELFPEAAGYYATALHELGHWTGHPSRLDRDLSHPFGSEGYAREELRAEISSMIVGNEIGTGHDPGQHAAYVQSWIKALKDDPLEIFRAAADAERMSAYVLGLEQRQEQRHDQRQQMSAESFQRGETVTVTMPVSLAYQQGLTTLDSGEVTRVPARVTGHADGRVLLGAHAPFTANNGLVQLAADPEAVQRDSLSSSYTKALANTPLYQYSAPVRVDAPTAQPSPVDRAWSAWEHSRDTRLPHEAQADAYDILRTTPAVATRMNARVTLPLMVAAAAGAIRAHATGDERAGAVLDALAAWNHRNATYTGSDLFAEARTAMNEANRSRVRDADLDAPRPSEIGADAARVEHVRERERAQTVNPTATAEDATVVRAERRDTERQAERTADRAVQTERQQAADRAAADNQAVARTYITVPFREKEQAKGHGAKWDRQQSSWYIPPGVPKEPFAKWMAAPTAQAEQAPAARPQAPAAPAADRVFLAVPYEQRAEAKALGALWDKTAKSWYAPAGANLEQLVKWLPENVDRQQAPALTPRDEFTQVLKGLDMVVDGEHPIADGKHHRIRLATDKGKETSGFYVFHLDEGVPAGFAQNNRTGEKVKWKAKGYHLDNADRARLAAQAAETQQRRAAELDRQHERVAQETEARLVALPPVAAGAQTPYLALKGVVASPGIFQEGEATVIPAIDTTGKVWSAQTIGDPALGGGTVKSFAKGGRKTGTFHALGGLAEIAKAPAVIIAEGYATAASLRDGAGFGTVCAFDAGNMPSVAKALSERFPDKPIILAGDENSIGRDGKTVTVGRDKAEQAAAEVGGTTMFPVFRSTGTAGKGKTDFNDMANEDAHGREAVSRHVRAAVQIAQRRQTERAQQQQQTQQQGRTLERAGQGQRLSQGRR